MGVYNREGTMQQIALSRHKISGGDDDGDDGDGGDDDDSEEGSDDSSDYDESSVQSIDEWPRAWTERRRGGRRRR